MSNWKNLPLELLSYIYTNLSERDLLSCHLVCLNWRKALNTIYLWKTTIVRIDVDFSEPSKILLNRNYCKFIKNLEVGWKQPLQIYTLGGQHHNRTTKRVVRFFSTLYDNNVQIVSLRIFNWYNLTIYKKILYHMCRFLKKQNRLEKVAFNNITLKKNNYIVLLRACLASKNTITYFDISDYYYYSENFEPIYLYSYVKQLSNLKTLKLGYRLFSTNTTRYIAENCNKGLENLEIIFDDWKSYNYFIHDEEWCQLKNTLPKLVVFFGIKTTKDFGNFHMYLTDSIPLVSLSIRILENKEADKIQINFANIMYYLSENYNKTLEKLLLHFNNNDENIDHPFLTILRKCKKLNSFTFEGFFEYFANIQSICAELGCCLITKKYKSCKCIVVDANEKEFNEICHRRIKFVLKKCGKKKVCSVCVMN